MGNLANIVSKSSYRCKTQEKESTCMWVRVATNLCYRKTVTCEMKLRMYPPPCPLTERVRPLYKKSTLPSNKFLHPASSPHVHTPLNRSLARSLIGARRRWPSICGVFPTPPEAFPCFFHKSFLLSSSKFIPGLSFRCSLCD